MTVSRYDHVSMAAGVATIATSAAAPPSTTGGAAELSVLDHQQTSAGGGPPTTTAFDNPMFNADACMAPAESEASADDRQLIETIGAANGLEMAESGVGLLIDVGDGMECENLVEISLDSTETINKQ